MFEKRVRARVSGIIFDDPMNHSCAYFGRSTMSIQERRQACFPLSATDLSERVTARMAAETK